MFQKYLITAIVISLFTTSANAQWNLSYYSNNSYAPLSVINKDTIVTTDYSGRMYYSHDSGDDWQFYQTQFSNSYFWDMHFPTSTVGYACGGTMGFGPYYSILIKTTDGGVTWDSLSTNQLPGGNVYFADQVTGFVSGGNELWKTTDGGQNFAPTDLQLPSDVIITEIYFDSPSVGIVATISYTNEQKHFITIERTADLGVTWNTVYNDTIFENSSTVYYEKINVFHFPNSNVGYAAGGNGLFLKTTDGGLTWTKQYLAPYTNLTGLFFTSPSVGYINNAGGIYKTTDGGQTWTVQNISPLGIISEIAFANAAVGYAVGKDGIYKTTNGGGLNVKEHEQSSLIVYPNPADDLLHIQLGKNTTILSGCIFNNLGEKAKSFSDAETIDVSGLNAGLYFLKLKTTDGDYYKKIIVE